MMTKIIAINGSEFEVKLKMTKQGDKYDYTKYSATLLKDYTFKDGTLLYKKGQVLKINELHLVN